MALVIHTKTTTKPSTSTDSNAAASLVDSSWETVDPNPDMHALFLMFNDQFFHGALAGCEVRWSPRMTYCAGLCMYEGRGGLCSIRLSEPLLKFRPRKDLVETLLHEMIHAYLFVSVGDRDRESHGPQFQAHMKRINATTGANVTIYHTFHSEVDYHRQHWWRCGGSCRDRPPYFGYVKRSMNRPPGPNDTWHNEHQRTCGGHFEKIKEPEKRPKKTAKAPAAAVTNEKTKRKNEDTTGNRFPGDGRVLGDGGGKMRRLEDFFPPIGRTAPCGSTSPKETELISCPICQRQIEPTAVNQHLDDCLTQSMLNEEQDEGPSC